ncbi:MULTISPECIES: hypothetical protein [unclassified Streptomyces]|uniref:hypothetical protein n=1 Tax=unclassified Streptomyces TaxID=2593676 RepID=UPI00081E6DA1|nr:hypothetical protein [Streptomyces sp. SID4937]MYR98377.1 hypothetical protein [Streptomyces sp. SID4937]SCE37275.1 hypothetical protein GA0115243_1115268 [Streptomyces sp. ScaeMP-e83]
MKALRPGSGTVPPELFASLCDDAAVSPPGGIPLTEAVPAHRGHIASARAPLVGPLVLPQARPAGRDATRVAELLGAPSP